MHPLYKTCWFTVFQHWNIFVITTLNLKKKNTCMYTLREFFNWDFVQVFQHVRKHHNPTMGSWMNGRCIFNGQAL